jgi:hypothetical protein
MTDNIINQNELTENFLNQASVASYAEINYIPSRISIGTDDSGKEFVYFTDKTNEVDHEGLRVQMDSVFETNPGEWEAKNEFGQLISICFIKPGSISNKSSQDNDEEVVDKITNLLLSEYRVTGMQGVKAALRLAVMHFAHEFEGGGNDLDLTPTEEEMENIAADIAMSLTIPVYLHGNETSETDENKN